MRTSIGSTCDFQAGRRAMAGTGIEAFLRMPMRASAPAFTATVTAPAAPTPAGDTAPLSMLAHLAQ
jgi:hypothetical protein